MENNETTTETKVADMQDANPEKRAVQVDNKRLRDDKGHFLPNPDKTCTHKPSRKPKKQKEDENTVKIRIIKEEQPLPEKEYEGKLEDAANLYLQAKDVLAERLSWSDFFGDINIMKWLIEDLYEIIEFDPEYVDLFDLFYVLKQPAKVTFYYDDEKHTIESLIEDGVCVVRFDDKWYRDRDEFFKKARLDERKLTSIHDYLYGFEVIML